MFFNRKRILYFIILFIALDYLKSKNKVIVTRNGISDSNNFEHTTDLFLFLHIEKTGGTYFRYRIE